MTKKHVTSDFILLVAVIRSCSIKKISENFLGLNRKTRTSIKLLFAKCCKPKDKASIKMTPVQVFSSEIYDIFRNNYSIVNMNGCFTYFSR